MKLGVHGALQRVAFQPLGGADGGDGGEANHVLSRNPTLLGEMGLNQGVWHDKGDDAVCQYTVVSKEA